MKLNNFNLSKIKKVMAAGMIMITVASFSGCNFVSAKTTNQNTSVNQPSTTSSTSTYSESDNNEINKTDPCNTLFDELDEQKVSIDDTTEYMLDNMDSIDPNDNKITDEEIQIASYAYQKLVKAGISKDVFLKELNNLLIEQTVPRDMDQQEWQDNFGDLNKTLKEKESLYDTYFVLAYLIHETACTSEHSLNEYGALTCKVLEKEFSAKYNK